jgi:hypothetical protein
MGIARSALRSECAFRRTSHIPPVTWRLAVVIDEIQREPFRG